MNTREKFSVVLVVAGLILAILPLSGNRSFNVKPGKLLGTVLRSNSVFTADQVARFIVTEDSTVQLIDLRSPEEFRSFNLPGSINIPYRELLDKDPATFLGNGNMKNIFYSNDDYDSNFALTIAGGLGFENCYVMTGGLNGWFTTVMNSEFKGDRITARENALYETRTKAKKLFTEINSLPDSLKIKFRKARRFDPKKLDGGCE